MNAKRKNSSLMHSRGSGDLSGYLFDDRAQAGIFYHSETIALGKRLSVIELPKDSDMIDNPTVARIPRIARQQAADPHLRLIGAVPAARSLQPADLDGLPRIDFTGGMTCNEAGRKPDRHWTGISLRVLLDVARADPNVRFINVSCGPYAAAVGIDRADEVLLADLVDGQPITLEQGGPWRLIIPEGRNYDSVKWVDTIEFSLETPNLASERISQARTRAWERREQSA